MRKLIAILLSLLLASLVIGSAAVVFSPKVRSDFVKYISTSDCDTPITYKLGTLDPKFHLNQDTAQNDLLQATKLWSQVYGKDLFTQSESATVVVNFIYDERTALNSQISQQQTQLTKNNSSLQTKINAYNAQVKEFEAKLADLNSKIEAANQAGGASQDQFASLQAQQHALKTEGDSLNAKAIELNQATHNYNSNVKNLNQNVSQFNQEIKQKPEEGLYDTGSHTITIYFASNQNELIHTLAHEFGHSLGMQHTDDPKAIMNPITTSYTMITQQDAAQLTYLCREQVVPSRKLQNLLIQISNYFQKSKASATTTTSS